MEKPQGMSRRGFLAAAGTVAAGTLSVDVGESATAAPTPGSGAIRFGVTAEQGASYGEILRFWRTAERLGFDSAFVYDHFMAAVPGPPERERCLEAWSLLSACAARTRRIRIGVLVTGNTYRYPALVAKMASTVDQVSGGRLIPGIGAGWLEREHVAYGIPFYTKAGRAKRLAEAVEAIKLLFTQERSNFTGKYFTLKDAPCEPKPVQKPHPPILVGGMGPKIVQPLAARHADIWHFVVRGNDPVEARRACESFDRLCGEIGRDPRAIEKATSLDPRLAASPANEVRGQVRALVDAGLRHFVLAPPPGNDLEVLRWFAKEVIPKFRTA